MKESKIIQQSNPDRFEELINKRLNEGYQIVSTNMFTTKDPFNPYVYYALLIKEC